MDKKKIKRIIAREGLLSIILLIGIIFILFWNARIRFLQDLLKVIPTSVKAEDFLATHFYFWVGFLFISCYLLIMFIRFIIWAVRTLKSERRQEQGWAREEDKNRTEGPKSEFNSEQDAKGITKEEALRRWRANPNDKRTWGQVVGAWEKVK